MKTRLELQSKLEELLGFRHVYYQPPESVKMEYPAIRYSKSMIRSQEANNGTYIENERYEITVIDKKPDNPVIKKLLALPHCGYERQYRADNLNHDVLTIYL
ncbi:hypothetical protein [Blautia glucerasea]|jgi:hypothetical protein|uniref:hypothetical protein n=1 Tax=Blautia glucerasea TaxID=536633 RepID=UPI0015704C83|nr:hypothetical protein [Blautia glucerasea]NSJ25532.1 hypothetical protein [Blautia glucerasea]